MSRVDEAIDYLKASRFPLERIEEFKTITEAIDLLKECTESIKKIKMYNDRCIKELPGERTIPITYLFSNIETECFKLKQKLDELMGDGE